MDRGHNLNRMKRILEDNDDDQPERKRPALASVIVEAMKVDNLQKLCSSLEPILRRVVNEEIERALAKLVPARFTGSSGSSPKRIGGPDGRKLQLHFKSRLALPLFTGARVEGEQGAAIHVVLVDANTGRPVTFGPEASLKLEVVVLGGDFNSEDEEDWTQEEFESHVVKEREGKRPLLNGELYVVLKEGVGTLGELVFTDNSSWIRSRKFRLGLRVASGCCGGGVRIREAKTESFVVKDHRGELYKKHYPPGLSDEVWRLEKIGKDGAFHKRLTAAGIVCVEDFLRKLVREPAKLRGILGSGMSNKMWDVLVEHAKTCVLSGKLYIYYAEDSRTVGAVFNNIYELNGLISGDQYFSADSLSDSQKVYVDGLVKKAYENWNQAVEYEGKTLLNFNQPERLDNSQTADPENYSTATATANHPMQVAGLPSSLPHNQYSVLSEFSIGGYNQPQQDRFMGYVAQPHDLAAQFQIVSQQDQFMGVHETQHTIENENVTRSALGLPQSFTGGYQDIGTSLHQANLNPLGNWSNHGFISEEEIRRRSHEMLENEDMRQLLQIFSNGEEGLAFMPNTPLMQGYGEEDRVRSGKAVVGWLKIKAAMRWGIFVRKKAAERRAQIVELDSVDD